EDLAALVRHLELQDGVAAWVLALDVLEETAIVGSEHRTLPVGGGAQALLDLRLGAADQQAEALGVGDRAARHPQCALVARGVGDDLPASRRAALARADAVADLAALGLRA